MEQNNKINLEEHKVFVASYNMDMVPYSVALKALEQSGGEQVNKYLKDLEFAMNELHRTMNQASLSE